VSGSGFRTIGCQRPAKVEHDGELYCSGVHDPDRKRLQRAKTRARWAAQSKVESAKRDMKRHDIKLVAWALNHLPLGHELRTELAQLQKWQLSS
jgi:hypothetical protein